MVTNVCPKCNEPLLALKGVQWCITYRCEQQRPVAIQAPHKSLGDYYGYYQKPMILQ